MTVANNTSNNGGGLYVHGGRATNINNSIFYDNFPQQIGFADDGMPNTIYVSYSIIEDGENGVIEYTGDNLYWGSGNVVDDPLFTDADNGDYTLQASSPAINAGNPNGFYNDSDGTRNDMGYAGGNGLLVSTFDILHDGNSIPQITPLEINFGNVGIGNSAPSEAFYIYNTRTDSVILGSYTTNDNQFTVPNISFPVTIQSFDKGSFNVQFLAT